MPRMLEKGKVKKKPVRRKLKRNEVTQCVLLRKADKYCNKDASLNLLFADLLTPHENNNKDEKLIKEELGCDASPGPEGGMEEGKVAAWVIHGE